MHAPQIIYLALVAAGIGVSIARYGQPKTDSYDMFDVAVAPALMIGLLYWGGFFG